MDHLVLSAVARELDARLRGSRISGVAEEARGRFNLQFEGDRGRESVVASIDPARPWIGRPVGRWPILLRTPSPFGAAARRFLEGTIVARVSRAEADRRLSLELEGGAALLLELVPHRANAILVGATGDVLGSARRRGGARRTTAPRERPDPLSADGEQIRRRVDDEVMAGRSVSEALHHGLFGISRPLADLIADEAGREGMHAVDLLLRRVDALRHGRIGPTLEAPADPLVLAIRGRLGPERCTLHPWTPARPPNPGAAYVRLANAIETVGLYHDGLERATLVGRRAEHLRVLTEREIRRVVETRAAVGRDIAGFCDPDRFRRWGEALLAGLSQAQRGAEQIRVPDPYDDSGDWVVVPTKPGKTPVQAATDCFQRHRRAVRGIEQARARADTLDRRHQVLAAILARFSGPDDPEEVDAFERALRQAAIPVGLEPRNRMERGATNLRRPSLEGVRLLVSSRGVSILVGKGARDNDRLTFRIAQAEDFWLHALGATGAHVIVRNPERRPQPDGATLEEAAEAAAWFSDARRQVHVDVQWTRKKYVRRIRNAPPGTVVVKRFETIRVRPRRLPDPREGIDGSI